MPEVMIDCEAPGCTKSITAESGAVALGLMQLHQMFMPVRRSRNPQKWTGQESQGAFVARSGPLLSVNAQCSRTPSWPGSWVTRWPAVQEGWCGESPGPRPYWAASGRPFFWDCHWLWALTPCYVAMLQGSQGVFFLSLLGLHHASGLALPSPASGWVLWRAGMWQMECRMGPVVSPYLALPWWSVAGEGIYWKSMLQIPRPARLSF